MAGPASFLTVERRRGLFTLVKAPVESRGEVMREPSRTGRMGSDWVADASRLMALLKRSIWASMMVSRDNALRHAESEAEQFIALLKYVCKVDWVDVERKP